MSFFEELKRRKVIRVAATYAVVSWILMQIGEVTFPALNIRESHERPEGMEEAAVIMTGLQKERIMQSLAIIDKQPRGMQRLIRQVDDYSMPNVSDKVVRIIHSYTDYVNRVVWKKY